MNCPCCLGGQRFIKTENIVPWRLFPLRLLVTCIYCDSCLQFFYRVRWVGWLIRSAGPDECMWDDISRSGEPFGPLVRHTQRTRSTRSRLRSHSRLEQEDAASDR
jgi:hypothetical protein